MGFVQQLALAGVSGLYTALWGAYKDSPYEGFFWSRFVRSMLFSLAILGLLPRLGVELRGLAPFALFFVIMGVERTFSEVYKWSFRAPRNLGRFAIPQQLTWFGRALPAWTRVAFGVALTVALVAGVMAPLTISSLAGFVVVGCGAGLGVSIGGAYKDAPFEGFLWHKFFRSAIVLTVLAPAVWLAGPLPLGVLFFIYVGLERLLVEYWKSFLVGIVPGKFHARAADEVEPRRILKRRFHLQLGASVIAVGALGLYTQLIWHW